MAGIYIHIPFCKQACHYCDFHFSTSPQLKNKMVAALTAEIILQNKYLGNQKVETIYFGGGTPSLLTPDEIETIIFTITDNFEVTPDVEITLETNPDDLNPQKVKELKQTLVNRFSIGIQSFYEEDLKWMNRAHNSKEAESSIKRVQDAGYDNITVDLIYGYPLLSNDKWESNVQKIIENKIPHVSSYAMTVEPATALAAFISKGKQTVMNEAQSAAQYVALIESLVNAGFEHYEISNFAKPGWHSRHNSNYWKGVSYLGIGPSAHSFNGESRQWNIANNNRYIEALEKNSIPAEVEILTVINRLNEYIMTALRTSLGLDLQKISIDFGSEYSSKIKENLGEHIDKNWINHNDNVVTLTTEGKLFADKISSELFLDDLSEIL